MDSIPPYFLTSFRLILASFFLIFICWYNGISNNFSIDKKSLMIIAILGNVIPFNLIAWSELYVDSVIASSLIGTMPLFTFVISKFFKGAQKNLKLNTFFGLIIGFIGMIIFVNPTGSFVFNYSAFFSAIIVFSAICYAFSANWVKTLNKHSSLKIASESTIVATIISLPVSFFFQYYSEKDFFENIENVSFKSFLSASILGLICTGFAIIIFFKIIKLQSAVFASQSNYLIPCFGFIWSFIFLNEILDFSLLFGLAFIVIGGFLVNKNIST